MDDPEEKSSENFGYTAFEKWDYRQIIYVVEEGQEKLWVDMGQSFYHASYHLVQGVINGSLREDIEGVAAVYLFRHYLELALKSIILSGRYLEKNGAIVPREQVRKVANIHDLEDLWESLHAGAQPKIQKEHWDNYDIRFIEKCIMEFDAVDKKGFAFRYAGHGGERCNFDFGVMIAEMEHAYQVLEGLITYLVETYHQTAEWLAELRSEAGW